VNTNGGHAMVADIVVEMDGPGATVALLNGATPAGADWLDTHVEPDAQRWGGRVVCEHRHVAAIVEGARADGLNVETGYMTAHGKVSVEAFREMVNQRVLARVGVSLDDLPDVNLDDWLDDDDGIAGDVAGEAADNAVAEILADNGLEGDA